MSECSFPWSPFAQLMPLHINNVVYTENNNSNRNKISKLLQLTQLWITGIKEWIWYAWRIKLLFLCIVCCVCCVCIRIYGINVYNFVTFLIFLHTLFLLYSSSIVRVGRGAQSRKTIRRRLRNLWIFIAIPNMIHISIVFDMGYLIKPRQQQQQ